MKFTRAQLRSLNAALASATQNESSFMQAHIDTYTKKVLPGYEHVIRRGKANLRSWAKLRKKIVAELAKLEDGK